MLLIRLTELTCMYRQEVGVFGVSVHIIEPGRYKTAMTEKVAFAESFKQSWQSLPQATRDEYGEHYLDAGE
jgi:NAD(P)-dependent dehydrogenase (short-subunit alcohol dehydrogenase family)